MTLTLLFSSTQSRLPTNLDLASLSMLLCPCFSVHPNKCLPVTCHLSCTLYNCVSYGVPRVTVNSWANPARLINVSRELIFPCVLIPQVRIVTHSMVVAEHKRTDIINRSGHDLPEVEKTATITSHFHCYSRLNNTCRCLSKEVCSSSAPPPHGSKPWLMPAAFWSLAMTGSCSFHVFRSWGSILFTAWEK